MKTTLERGGLFTPNAFRERPRLHGYSRGHRPHEDCGCALELGIVYIGKRIGV
jgi:hypothetical protein